MIGWEKWEKLYKNVLQTRMKYKICCALPVFIRPLFYYILSRFFVVMWLLMTLFWIAVVDNIGMEVMPFVQWTFPSEKMFELTVSGFDLPTSGSVQKIF